MGWGIQLMQGGEVVEVAAHTLGSNVVVGGNPEASMTVTFNYSPRYFGSGVQTPEPWEHHGELREDFSPWWLHGRSGRETAPVLFAVVQALGTERSDNYWEATPGNAGFVVAEMLRWALDHPDAVWAVD